MYATLKRLLIGSPIPTADEGHQRLSKKIALPVFASDAISSTAYATDEILLVLLGQAGIGYLAFRKLVPIAIVVAVLLTIVVLSYRQTIFRYPAGGGTYIVTKDNLGLTPALIAASALMIDYVLTVATSLASGVDAFFSLLPLSAQAFKLTTELILIVLMTGLNFRGMRESILACPGS